MSRLTDDQAAAAITAHHEELSGEIRNRVEALQATVRAGDAPWAARDRVLAYLDGELLPHARAEEEALYPAGDRGRSELLVRAMRDEHRNLVAHVDRLRHADDATEAATTAAAILALFESHLSKENDLLVPELVADPSIEVGALLEGMHELVG